MKVRRAGERRHPGSSYLAQTVRLSSKTVAPRVFRDATAIAKGFRTTFSIFDPNCRRHIWVHAGEDRCNYRGRDMALRHRGIRISENDWNVFLGHAVATLAKFCVPEAEQREVVTFIESLKKDIAE